MPADLDAVTEQYQGLDADQRQDYRLHLMAEATAAREAGQHVTADRWAALLFHVAQLEADRANAWTATVAELEGPDEPPPAA